MLRANMPERYCKSDRTNNTSDTYQWAENYSNMSKKGTCNAQARRLANDSYSGGMGDKMEDWVERLHQWGIRQRQRFRTVQDPFVCATAREKATSQCNHPEVLAQVDASNARNKRILSEKREDTVSTKRKQQRDEGRIRAHQYFASIKGVKLTWAELVFNEWGGRGKSVNKADDGTDG